MARMVYIGKLIKLNQWLCLLIGPSYIIAGIVSWRTGINLRDLVGSDTTWTVWMTVGVAATTFGLMGALRSTGYRFGLYTLWKFTASILVLLALGLRFPQYTRWFAFANWAICAALFWQYAAADLFANATKPSKPN